jgi:hypothetical protein
VYGIALRVIQELVAHCEMSRAKVVSRSYDEGLVGLVGSQVPLVQGVLDVLASHLKPVFFGAKVVEECLKNFNDLKVGRRTCRAIG